VNANEACSYIRNRISCVIKHVQSFLLTTLLQILCTFCGTSFFFCHKPQLNTGADEFVLTHLLLY